MALITSDCDAMCIVWREFLPNSWVIATSTYHFNLSSSYAGKTCACLRTMHTGRIHSPAVRSAWEGEAQRQMCPRILADSGVVRTHEPEHPVLGAQPGHPAVGRRCACRSIPRGSAPAVQKKMIVFQQNDWMTHKYLGNMVSFFGRLGTECGVVWCCVTFYRGRGCQQVGSIIAANE